MQNLRNIFRGKIGDQVPEFVRLKHQAFPEIRRSGFGLGRKKADVIGDLFAKLVAIHALAQVGSYGRKNIASVERITDGVMEVMFGSDVPDRYTLLAFIDQ